MSILLLGLLLCNYEPLVLPCLCLLNRERMLLGIQLVSRLLLLSHLEAMMLHECGILLIQHLLP